MQTWKLVELIPTDRKVFVKDIVNVKKDEHVGNLMRWYVKVKEVIQELLSKEATKIGRGQLASPIPAIRTLLRKEATKMVQGCYCLQNHDLSNSE